MTRTDLRKESRVGHEEDRHQTGPGDGRPRHRPQLGRHHREVLDVGGDQEKEQEIVAVRERSKGDLGTMTVDEFAAGAEKLRRDRSITNDAF